MIDPFVITVVLTPVRATVLDLNLVGGPLRRCAIDLRQRVPTPDGPSADMRGADAMCLGIPMRIVECQGFVARCEAGGVERSVSLFLVQHESVGPGDHVLVHVGYAIQKISQADSADTWALLDAMMAVEDEAGHA